LNLSADSVNLLVLASASARRRDLLSRLGVGFQVCPADVDESPWPGETPLETQLRITRDKARTAQTRLFTAYPALAERPVIACDTTVLLDGEMLNKPAGPEDARRMLRCLRGRTHQVQSVIVVRHGERETAEPVSTHVLMRDYDDEEIEAYIATGDPFDKAGSYAVQHPLFRPVAEMRGCPLNVVGLALCRLRACLPQLPDPSPVCQSFSGRPCPAYPDERHVVTQINPAFNT
jgi:septum formation protein